MWTGLKVLKVYGIGTVFFFPCQNPGLPGRLLKLIIGRVSEHTQFSGNCSIGEVMVGTLVCII